jgi:hypothetical protein
MELIQNCIWGRELAFRLRCILIHGGENGEGISVI